MAVRRGAGKLTPRDTQNFLWGFARLAVPTIVLRVSSFWRSSAVEAKRNFNPQNGIFVLRKFLTRGVGMGKPF